MVLYLVGYPGLLQIALVFPTKFLDGLLAILDPTTPNCGCVLRTHQQGSDQRQEGAFRVDENLKVFIVEFAKGSFFGVEIQ